MIVDCAVYEDGRRRTGDLALADAYEAAHRANAFVWIGLYEPSEEEFDSVQREFDLHELAVEDAIKAHQRPKLKVYGDSLFVVLKTARYLEPDDVEFGEILLFIGDSSSSRCVTARPLSTTSACAWRSGPICSAPVPGPRCTQSSTGSSTTTNR